MEPTSDEIEGSHGVHVDEVLDKANEVIGRILAEKGLMDKPDPVGADFMPYANDVNNEVHHAIPTLPRDIWVKVDSATTSVDRPGWWRVTVKLERRTVLGKGEYEWE